MPLRGVPTKGAEVWTVKGVGRFIVYRVPGTRPKPGVPIVWKVSDSGWKAIGGGDTKDVKTKTLTKEQAKAAGWVKMGSADEIKAEEDINGFQFLKKKFKENAEIRPWLRDPQIMARVAGAWYEGRELSEQELKTSQWWRSRSEASRQWASLVNSDPKEARQQMGETRLKVEQALREAGMGAPTEELVKFLADDFTRGYYGEQELQKKIAAAVDPFAADAGPFAGLDASSLDGVGRLVRDKKGRLAIRTKEGDWLVRGKGTRARFGGADAGKRVGKLKVVGDASEIAGRLRGEGPDGLGGYEKVRELVRSHVGPRLAGQYGDDWINSEAAKLRQDEAYEDQLRQRLRSTFKATFGDVYGDDVIYEDVAPGVRSSIEQVWGRTVDESDDVFTEAFRRADLAERRRYLTQEGLRQGVGRVTDDALAGLGQAVGGSVRRAV